MHTNSMTTDDSVQTGNPPAAHRPYRRGPSMNGVCTGRGIGLRSQMRATARCITLCDRLSLTLGTRGARHPGTLRFDCRGARSVRTFIIHPAVHGDGFRPLSPVEHKRNARQSFGLLAVCVDLGEHSRQQSRPCRKPGDVAVTAMNRLHCQTERPDDKRLAGRGGQKTAADRAVLLLKHHEPGLRRHQGFEARETAAAHAEQIGLRALIVPKYGCTNAETRLLGCAAPRR